MSDRGPSHAGVLVLEQEWLHVQQHTGRADLCFSVSFGCGQPSPAHIIPAPLPASTSQPQREREDEKCLDLGAFASASV